MPGTLPLLLFTVLALSFGATACTSITGRSAAAPAGPHTQAGRGGQGIVGLRVTEVTAGSAGERAGLRLGDIILQYGDAEVVDKASFYAAREGYQNRRVGSVQLVAWRGNGPVTFTVPVGRLGIETGEFNTTAHKFYSLVDSADAVKRWPEDILRREKESGRYRSPEEVLQEARQLLDAAEREGSLTTAQVLVARIYMTPDDAPPDEVRVQMELLRRLLSTQPRDYVATLGHEQFFEKKRYRAAVECFKSRLEADPSDASTWLNLGVSYNSLGMHREAAEAADYVLGRRLPLSEHGYGVAYQVKALAALGLGDTRGGVEFAGKQFALNPTDFGMSLWQLAAARGGDLRLFYEVTRSCQQALPEDFTRLKRQADAVEAYALAKSGRRESARRIVRGWPSEGDARKVKKYWAVYPGGADVAHNWAGLLGNAY